MELFSLCQRVKYSGRGFPGFDPKVTEMKSILTPTASVTTWLCIF